MVEPANETNSGEEFSETASGNPDPHLNQFNISTDFDQAENTLPMPPPPSAALLKMREYFTRISLRERDLGIPVGAFILPRHVAGTLKQKWPQTTECGRIGLTKVRDLPGDPNYLVVHLSTHTAKIFAFSRHLIGNDLEEFLRTSGAEYYPGVRVHEPIFDLPLVGNHSTEPPSRFTFAEIFAGIGGFRLGLEALGGKCVFASEIDAGARATYALNFGCSSGELCGDITEYYGADLPPIDLLTGGFPCQSFSVRGEQKGLEDPRGQLFRELHRLLTVCQPKAFLFENVAHLVTMDGGKRNHRDSSMDEMRVGQTFQMMLDTFTSTGYDITWNIINSRHWLPQQRERVYLVGFRRDLGITSPEEVFDWRLGRPYWSGSHGKIIDDTLTTPGLLSCVRDILEEDPTAPSVQGAALTEIQWERLNKPENVEKANKWQNASERGGRNRSIPLDGKSPTVTSSYRNVSSFSTRFVFEEKDGQKRPIPRFLTERECARLMGLPDSFLFTDTKGYRSYHHIGNAVCPPVVKAIGEEILRVLRL
jgi:DNA (cytosine-5)-methyltransferase 1